MDDEFYVAPKYLNEQENGGVAVVTGRRVTKVDAQKKTVLLDNSWEISFDKCLIATGGRPRNLPVFEKADDLKNKVTLFRNVNVINIKIKKLKIKIKHFFVDCRFQKFTRNC